MSSLCCISVCIFSLRLPPLRSGLVLSLLSLLHSSSSDALRYTTVPIFFKISLFSFRTGRPPPTETTHFFRESANSFTVSVSISLNAASPFDANISLIVVFSFFSIYSSVSQNEYPYFLDIHFPKVVLPLPINPIRTILSFNSKFLFHFVVYYISFFL